MTKFLQIKKGIKKMNKTQLIEKVAQAAGIKKSESEKAVNAVFAAMEEALADGDKVQLVGFGTFGVKAREARTGRNPQTGAAMTIPASKNVAFTAGSALKAKVNK